LGHFASCLSKAHPKFDGTQVFRNGLYLWSFRSAHYACPEGFRAVGLDINANHPRGATSGYVTGITRPVHIGRSTQVWQIDMFNDAGEMTCASRITMAVLTMKL
jgi:acyl-coenzyme A thioesterase PaaI-like protein